MRRNILSALLVFVLGAAAQAAGPLVVGDFSGGVDAQGIPAGWQLRERSGHAALAVVQTDGLHALQLCSTNTSFSLQRPLNANLVDYPVLTWKWKVTKLPEGGDFRKASTDDQAAQLFVAFSRSRTIVYIWDTTAPQGFMGDALAPPFMSIKLVVVRSSPAEAGKWLTETRNVYEDYKHFFGASEKPPVVSGMRLQINTQHTKTSAESYFADLQFQKDEKRAAANPAGS